MSLVSRYGHPMGKVDRLCRAFPVVVLSGHGVTVGSISDPVSVATEGTAKTFRRDAIKLSFTGTFPIKASESFDDVHNACLEIRRKSPPRMAEICRDGRSEEFHSSESVQHPAFYRYRES